MRAVNKVITFVKRFLNRRSLYLLIFSVILVVLASGGTYFFLNRETGGVGSNSAQAEKNKILREVGKLIDLPSEDPILARISDISILSRQPFYKNAKNGDVLLVFQTSGTVVLYRESENKIINVGRVSPEEAGLLGQSASKPESLTSDNLSSQEETSIKVAIYNGTKTAGLARKTADDLLAKYPNIEVIYVSKSVGEYAKTLIVDLSGKNKTTAESLAKYLNGDLGILPQGEAATPGAQIVVILGQE